MPRDTHRVRIRIRIASVYVFFRGTLSGERFPRVGIKRVGGILESGLSRRNGRLMILNGRR